MKHGKVLAALTVIGAGAFLAGKCLSDKKQKASVPACEGELEFVAKLTPVEDDPEHTEEAEPEAETGAAQQPKSEEDHHA